MKRLARLGVVTAAVLVAAVLCTYGIVTSATPSDGEPARRTTSADPNAAVRLPPVIEVGDRGAYLRDVHATLNKKLGVGGPIDVHGHFESVGPIPGDAEKQVLTTRKGVRLHVPDHWGIEVDARGWPTKIDVGTKGIDSIGVYGEITYTLVTLFQLQKGLNPTGEVDAVTLHELEPLLPASSPVLGAVR